MIRVKCRFGSLATISAPCGDVRFTPESDRLVHRRKATFTDGMADKFALFLVRFFQF
jgi:hypothetical protein